MRRPCGPGPPSDRRNGSRRGRRRRRRCAVERSCLSRQIVVHVRARPVRRTSLAGPSVHEHRGSWTGSVCREARHRSRLPADGGPGGRPRPGWVRVSFGRSTPRAPLRSRPLDGPSTHLSSSPDRWWDRTSFIEQDGHASVLYLRSRFLSRPEIARRRAGPHTWETRGRCSHAALNPGSRGCGNAFDLSAEGSCDLLLIDGPSERETGSARPRDRSWSEVVRSARRWSGHP